jgi:hypothetical protein
MKETSSEQPDFIDWEKFRQTHEYAEMLFLWLLTELIRQENFKMPTPAYIQKTLRSLNSQKDVLDHFKSQNMEIDARAVELFEKEYPNIEKHFSNPRLDKNPTEGPDKSTIN